MSLSASSCSPSRGRSLGRARSGSRGGGSGSGSGSGRSSSRSRTPRRVPPPPPPAPRRRRDRAAPTREQDKTRKPKRRRRARSCRAGLEVQDRRPAPRRSPGPAESARSPFEPGAAAAASPFSFAASTPHPFASPAVSPSPFRKFCSPGTVEASAAGLVCSANRTQQPQVSRSPFFLQPVPRTLPPWWRPAAGLPPSQGQTEAKVAG